jgi:hypothetical protein
MIRVAKISNVSKNLEKISSISDECKRVDLNYKKNMADCYKTTKLSSHVARCQIDLKTYAHIKTCT